MARMTLRTSRFSDAVDLDALAGGQPQRAVAVGVGQAVELAVQLGVDVAAGQAQAEHEREGELVAGLSPFDALVAIVLLVAAVELQQLVAGVGDEARG